MDSNGNTETSNNSSDKRSDTEINSITLKNNKMLKKEYIISNTMNFFI